MNKIFVLGILVALLATSTVVAADWVRVEYEPTEPGETSIEWDCGGSYACEGYKIKWDIYTKTSDQGDIWWPVLVRQSNPVEPIDPYYVRV